jgi:hypothetical protein
MKYLCDKIEIDGEVKSIRAVRGDGYVLSNG